MPASGARRHPIDALVLAGGRPAPAFSQENLPKAFAPLRGRAMVEFVLAALRDAPSIGRIGLVAPRPLPPAVAVRVDVPVEARGPLLENLAAGLEALGGTAPVLVVAADIPLLRAPAIETFLAGTGAEDVGVWYAIVPREDMARAFPDVRKTFVRLRDGTFTGGGLVLIRPGAFRSAHAIIERVIRARKRPWELACLFGACTLVGLLTGRLRIAELERRAAELTGVKARAVISHDPGVGLDVDRPQMLAVIEKCLGDRVESPPFRVEEPFRL